MENIGTTLFGTGLIAIVLEAFLSGESDQTKASGTSAPIDNVMNLALHAILAPAVADGRTASCG